MNQSKYIDDLLFKLQMINVKPALLPCVIGKHLSIQEGTPMEILFLYRSTIGVLQYLTYTRLDIAYMVKHLSQFLRAVKDIYWQVVKLVLWYINGTKHYGILLQPSPNFQVTVYSDVDWASNVDDHRSIATYCVFVGNNIVS